MSDEAAWRGLADHAVSLGQMSRAEADAGLAHDLVPEPDQPAAVRDSSGRFANAAPQPNAAEPTDVRVVRTMAKALLDAGKLTQREHDLMVAADLHSLSVASDFAADPTWQTADEATLDEYLDGHEANVAAKLPKGPDPLGKHELDPVWDRPSAPSEYKLPAAQSESLDVPTLKAIQQLAWQARLPQPVAKELFVIADNFMAKDDLTDDQIGLLTQNTMAQLRVRYGDQTDAKVAQGQRLIAEVAKVNPALLQLVGTGLGSDHRFVSYILAHADRLYGGGK